jgi:tripartite-type tricarboxylate transporter receptor subunit TctC
MIDCENRHGPVPFQEVEGYTGTRRLPACRGIRKVVESSIAEAQVAVKATIFAALMSMLVCAALPQPVAAQSYPAKTVTIVVPAAAGGGIDITARWLAAALQNALGKSFVVENKGGASGILGSQQVARAEPDGHTLLFTISGFLVTSPALFNALPWDPVKDFSAVGMVLRSPHVLVVNKDSPINSLAELIAYARANPGKLNYGSPGVTSETHIGSELFAQLANVQVTAVPYRGTGPAFNDLLSGHLGFFLNTMQTLMGPLQSHTIKGLAAAHATRLPLLPDIPTAAEAGLPGLEVSTWYALYAPAGTPRDVINLLGREIKKITERPEFKARVENTGATMSYMTPDELGKYTADEVSRWTGIIGKLNIPKQ